GYLGCRII
ncbi:chlamydia polymorphic membrane middle domain protein, partial [Chlamydia psittaci C1/97]